MLKHKIMPPSLHFKKPNPALDIENSPFYVNASLRAWESRQTRRAAVSSLGVGGTNAHVIVEEAPSSLQKSTSPRPRLMVMSARTNAALATMSANLAHELAHAKKDIADVAYTLQTGRKSFAHRQAFVCTDQQDAIDILTSRNPAKVFTENHNQADRSAAFLFPGQGSQYVFMAAGIYQREPAFKANVDSCCEILKPHLGFDLRDLLYPEPEYAQTADQKLAETAVTQPALFTIEFSLAKLLMSWGITPKAMLGNSIGEYVAACLAGVFTVDDALKLVALRGRLMQSAPRGSMLAIALSEHEIVPLLNHELSLASVNSEQLCVVAGNTTLIDQLATKLAAEDVYCRRLHTSHAFHSHMMERLQEPFAREVKKLRLRTPTLSFFSCVTGDWITAEAAKDSNYWSRQMRATVRLSSAIETLAANESFVPLEVGPGRTMTGLFKQRGRESVACLRHPNEKKEDDTSLLEAVGQLWVAGVKVDWNSLNAEEEFYRIPLPAYPFERKRYWIDPPRQPERAIPTDQDGNSSNDRRAKPATNAIEEVERIPRQVIQDDCGTSKSTELERLILQQLELISSQLDLLPAQD
jgi:acyl transferase domain-containing protein